MRFRSALVASLAIALVSTLWLPAPVATAHDAPNYCGSQRRSGAGWFDAYGHGVGCDRTKRIARKWQRKCSEQVCEEEEAVRINEWPGFTCRYRQTGYEVVRVLCAARGDRVVHFKWGS
jgi:hypothetical protein